MINWGYHKIIYKIEDLFKNSDTMIGIQIQLEYNGEKDMEIFSDKTKDFHLTYV